MTAVTAGTAAIASIERELGLWTQMAAGTAGTADIASRAMVV